MHAQGKSHIISCLDVKERVAHARPTAVNYFTKTRDDTDVNVVAPIEFYKGGLITRGEVQVITNIWAFNKLKERTMQIIETVELSLPAIRTNTHAVWFDLDEDVKVGCFFCNLTVSDHHDITFPCRRPFWSRA